MKVILAQGNPGPDYTQTRHNVGWRFLDAYAHKRSVAFAHKSKFQADIAELTVNGEKVLLVKPTTFYNETGVAARAIADFYKLTPDDFLIVHDDLALPLGTIRTRIGGSEAGNNGVRSLNAHLGDATNRLRIGIYDVDIPRSALSSVLGKLTSDETAALDEQAPRVFKMIDDFIVGNLEITTYKK